MKYTLSALAGSLLSTIAVVLAGHTPAILVGLGFVVGIALYTWVLRLLGIERYARWFYAGAGHPVKQGIDHLEKSRGRSSLGSIDSGQKQFSNRAGNSETSRPVRVRYGGRDGRTRPVGIESCGSSQPSCLPSTYVKVEWNAPGRSVGSVSERERGTLATGERTPRRAPTYNQKIIAVLRPVEQDVLSALMNLGCSFRQAEDAVTSVSDGGESFDQLFRKALDVLNAGKRKAVA